MGATTAEALGPVRQPGGGGELIVPTLASVSDDFRGVLVAPSADADFRIRFVELLTDGMRVYFTAEGAALSAIDQENAAKAMHDLFACIEVSDDVGTSYSYGGGGGCGSPASGLVRGEVRFGPTVPPEATELDLATPAATVRLPLA